MSHHRLSNVLQQPHMRMRTARNATSVRHGKSEGHETQGTCSLIARLNPIPKIGGIKSKNVFCSRTQKADEPVKVQTGAMTQTSNEKREQSE